MISVKDYLTRAIRKYASLSTPRLLTTGLTQAEIATVEGDRFNFSKRFTGTTTGVPIYILLENPSGSGVNIGFQKRILKSLDAGVASFQVFWGYDVSTATKTSIPYYNENDNFVGVNDGLLEVSLLNTVTTSTTGPWTITGDATIVDEGIEREPDFIPTSGVGNNTSGDISPELGFRVYGEGKGALIKIVTDSNNNDIIAGYDWIEAPTSL